LASTKVCDVEVELEVELELLAESSFFEQEMRVRLKNADRKMKIIFFIYHSNNKFNKKITLIIT